MKGKKAHKGKREFILQIFFFFSRGNIEMAISNSVSSLKGLEFLFKCDLACTEIFPRPDVKGNAPEIIRGQGWFIYVYNR